MNYFADSNVVVGNTIIDNRRDDFSKKSEQYYELKERFLEIATLLEKHDFLKNEFDYFLSIKNKILYFLSELCGREFWPLRFHAKTIRFIYRNMECQSSTN
jgi:hypothetical protein